MPVDRQNPSWEMKVLKLLFYAAAGYTLFFAKNRPYLFHSDLSISAALICAVLLTVTSSILCRKFPQAKTALSFCWLVIGASVLWVFGWGIREPFYGIKFLAATGAAMNCLAMASNGGLMPVNKNTAENKGLFKVGRTHVWADEKTRFVLLADQIGSRMVIISGVASIGDVLIYFGIIITALQLFFLL